MPGARALRLTGPLAALAATAGAFAYVAVVDPGQPGHYPVCPVLAATGYYCPGCGGLRAAHALARGQLGAALRDNALGVAGMAAFAVFLALWLTREARGRPFTPNVPPRALWAAGALITLFTLLRNTPFGTWLAP
jgi:hypothetical protein